MKAAYIDATGGPPESIRVGDLPDPRLAPGQVLVKVGATALNPIDLYLRSGFIPMVTAFPYVIGCDLAGTVTDIGPGATRFRVGERVWGSNQGMMGRQGTTSEFVAVDEDWLYPTPDRLTDPEAAALALTGITAHLGLFHWGKLQGGEFAYVSGGAGGVGSMVVQMARAVDARIATTAGRPESRKLAESLGADLVLDYHDDDLTAPLREFAPEGLDLWYETQREPDLETAIPLLRRRGRMIVMAGRAAKPTLPLGSFYPRDCSLLGFAMFNASAEEQRLAADDIRHWVEDGVLRPIIGRSFPLDQAAEAQRLLEDNTLNGAGTLVGKVVITLD